MSLRTGLRLFAYFAILIVCLWLPIYLYESHKYKSELQFLENCASESEIVKIELCKLDMKWGYVVLRSDTARIREM